MCYFEFVLIAENLFFEISCRMACKKKNSQELLIDKLYNPTKCFFLKGKRKSVIRKVSLSWVKTVYSKKKEKLKSYCPFY